MTRPAITVFGSVNLDIVARAERLPAPGETVPGGTLAMYPGGKGANQALAARRLGADVSLVARVGEDAHADQALALLRAAGVDLSLCHSVTDLPTGVALIIVGPDGENQIVVTPGANAALSEADANALPGAALICQLESPVQSVLAAAQCFEGLVVLNLAPALDVPDALLERADLVIVNESEAAFYGLETLQRAAGQVAVTLGAAGAILYQGTTEIARATPPAVTPVDTTGAGDSFVAALTFALMEGKPAQDALAFACAAGAASTLHHGAQPALPRRDMVEALLAGQDPHG